MTKNDFLKGMDTYGSHRKLLWEALQAMKESKFPVLELGSGPSSTPYLKKYCNDEGLVFYTYDSSSEWAKTMSSEGVTDWSVMTFWETKFSVCLLDLAPGEYRKTALMKLPNTQIIILHDSEPIGWNASDYRVRPLFKNFKYVKDDVPKEKGQPWTTALRQTIDVTKFSV